jgi:hypothetical protein
MISSMQLKRLKIKISGNGKHIQFKVNRITFLLIILCTCFSFQVNAQIKIAGKITTKEKKPLEFAEVIILNKDSMGIKSELVNEDGTFLLSIQPGRYTLQVRQLSKIFYTTVIDSQSDVNLGDIKVENAAQELGAVDIEVKDKLIERKIDRVVFNIENSISAAGSDALEALKITPGVRVQNDKITMIGKSTLAVMIDDKLVQLSGDDLANYLKSIPADLIKSIEVISTPPAKYEAAGNSGFINIKLKKSRRNAWNAMAGTSYTKRTYYDGSGFGNFTYNKNKLSISTSASYRKGIFYKTEDDDAYFPDGLWHTRSSIQYGYERVNANLNLDYQLTSWWTIGTQTMINMGNNYLNNDPYTHVYDYETGEKIRSIENRSPTKSMPVINSFNIYNEFKLDTLGKKMTFNMDYFYFSNTDRRIYEGTSFVAHPVSNQYFKGININDQRIPNFSGKLDVDFPVKWVNLTFGGKVSNSIAKNDISSFNSGLVDQLPVDGVLNQSSFQYQENVEAIYLSGNKKINSHWEAQAGLRMEATQTKTFSGNLDQAIKRNYEKFFPTAYVNYTINEYAAFTLNYSRRINRPSFFNLNPNSYYLSPYQTISGNPFLQPAFIDNVELVHAYKKLQSKLYYSYEDNMFAQLPFADPATNFIRFTDENYFSTKRLGLLENYTFDKFKWWTSTNELDVNYAAGISKVAVAPGKKGFNSRVSTSNDFVLNSKKTLLFNLSYWYGFRGVDGIFVTLPSSALSLGIQYLMLDKNLKLSAKVTDIFRTEKDRMQTTVNGVYQNGGYYHDSQSFQVSASYRFGNNTIKEKHRQTGNEEERNRVGN